MHTLPEYGNMANNRKRSITYLISRLESSALRERYMQAMQANTFGFEHSYKAVYSESCHNIKFAFSGNQFDSKRQAAK